MNGPLTSTPANDPGPVIEQWRNHESNSEFFNFVNMAEHYRNISHRPYQVEAVKILGDPSVVGATLLQNFYDHWFGRTKYTPHDSFASIFHAFYEPVIP